MVLACASRGKSLSTDVNCALEYDTLSNQYVYLYVDKMPEYLGGDKELLHFFAENFKYPKQEQFQATFLIEFIIGKEGKLVAPRIKGKDSSELSEAEKEVLKVLKKIPMWNAGSCNNKRVPVKMVFPLKL